MRLDLTLRISHVPLSHSQGEDGWPQQREWAWTGGGAEGEGWGHGEGKKGGRGGNRAGGGA
jgi:hypothetical protein